MKLSLNASPQLKFTDETSGKNYCHSWLKIMFLMFWSYHYFETTLPHQIYTSMMMRHGFVAKKRYSYNKAIIILSVLSMTCSASACSSCVRLCFCDRVSRFGGVEMQSRSVAQLLAAFCSRYCDPMSSSASGGLIHLKGLQTLPNIASAHLNPVVEAVGFLLARKTNAGGVGGEYLDKLQLSVLCWGWINAISLFNEEAAGLFASVAERWKRKPRGETLTTASRRRDA